MKTILCVLAALSLYTQASAQVQCIKGDCKNGYGSCVFPSGDKYMGDFKQGQLHGKGILYYKDGDKYIGNWDSGQRQGKGRMVFSNGDEYLGDFKNNQIEGEGALTFANGNRYEGQFLSGKPNGKGIFVYANNDRYEGWFASGQCEGQGTMFYGDGSVFDGAWMNNKRHGQGKMTFADGQTIQGQWNMDQFEADWGRLGFEGDTTALRDCNLVDCGDGSGKFHYRDGSKYVGTFVNGIPEGEGTMYYASGDRYEGGWKRHGPHGKGVMYYTNGKVTGAIWDYGKPAKKLFTREDPALEAPVSVDTDAEVKIWAVIIGAARYTHMPALRYTDDDAYQIFAFLKSPEGGALPDRQLKLLIDEDATRSNVLDAMRSTFLKADGNDVVLFYFSGHGLPGSFLPVDYDGYNNKLEHQEIRDMLVNSRAKHKLVLADACHSGSLNSKLPLNSVLEKYYSAFEESSGGTALLMSSKGEEYSLEDGGLRSGIFSHFLVKGLKGDADLSGDKIVTVRELFSFVHKQVRLYTGNVQTPTLTGQFDDRMPVAAVRY